MRKILGTIRTYKRCPNKWWGHKRAREDKENVKDGKENVKDIETGEHTLKAPLNDGKAAINPGMPLGQLPMNQRAVELISFETISSSQVEEKEFICLDEEESKSQKDEYSLEKVTRKRKRLESNEIVVISDSESQTVAQSPSMTKHESFLLLKDISENIHDEHLRDDQQTALGQTALGPSTAQESQFATAQRPVSLDDLWLADEEIPSSSPTHSPLQWDDEEECRLATPELNVPSSIRESDSNCKDIRDTVVNTQWWEDQEPFEIEEQLPIDRDEDERAIDLISDTESEDIELVSDSTPDSSPRMSQSYFRNLLTDSLIESLPVPSQRKLHYVRFFRQECETQDE